MQIPERTPHEIRNGRLYVAPRSVQLVGRPSLDFLSKSDPLPEVRRNTVEDTSMDKVEEDKTDSIDVYDQTESIAGEHEEPQLHHRKHKKPKSSKRSLQKTLRPSRLAVACLVFAIFGMGVYVTQTPQTKAVLSAQDAVSAQPADLTDRSYVPTLKEEKLSPELVNAYTTGASYPRFLTVQSVIAKSRVIPVGVDSRGQPRLPNHGYDVGWYNVSSRPGQAGAMVLSGLCTTPVSVGVFGKLHTVLNGDEIMIERGDGTILRYIVITSESVPTGSLDMTKVLQPVDVHAPGLNIVTCAGTYDNKTNDMSARFVVYARQI